MALLTQPIRRALLTVLLLSMACLSHRVLHAQVLHASGPLPSFEVATIKPLQAPPPPRPAGAPPLAQDEILLYINARMLIASAYNAQAFVPTAITGGPRWIDNQIFEIHARIEHAASEAMQKTSPPERQQQIKLMQQSLLAERFRLKAHFETRELPELALVVAKGGPKMAASDPSAPHVRPLPTPTGQGWQMKGTGASIRTVTDMLQMQPETAGRLIVDQTGLTGLYEITLNWQRDREPADETGPSLLTALPDQLGLRLLDTKGRVEIVVIDHIEQPSAN